MATLSICRWKCVQDVMSYNSVYNARVSMQIPHVASHNNFSYASGHMELLIVVSNSYENGGMCMDIIILLSALVNYNKCNHGSVKGQYNYL